jgi:hypothetical protein
VTAERVFPEGAANEIRHGLFEPTQEYGGTGWDREVLAPWIAANAAILSAVRRVGEAEMAAVTLASEPGGGAARPAPPAALGPRR